jgi:Uma2 family endonuclease
LNVEELMITTLPPLPRSKPKPVVKHWLVEEFHEVFSSAKRRSQRPYLVRGVVWEQGEMNPPHAYFVDVVNEVLRNIFQDGYRVRVQSSLVLGLDTDPQPDLAVVRGSAMDYRYVHPTTAELVVEISDTTIFEDQTTKAELYAAAGIAEYWIVDINENRLLVMRDPQAIEAGGNSYRSIQELRAGATVSPLAVPEVVIAVTELLNG